MKTQFERLRDYFATHGDELTDRDYIDLLHFLEVNDKITEPTDEQVIGEFERLVQIEFEDLDEQHIDLGIKGR
jgi:GGDEF domain-containing protein